MRSKQTTQNLFQFKQGMFLKPKAPSFCTLMILFSSRAALGAAVTDALWPGWPGAVLSLAWTHELPARWQSWGHSARPVALCSHFHVDAPWSRSRSCCRWRFRGKHPWHGSPCLDCGSQSMLLLRLCRQGWGKAPEQGLCELKPFFFVHFLQ